MENGIQVQLVLEQFASLIKISKYVVAHNLGFDEKVVRSEFLRAGISDYFNRTTKLCTKELGKDICKIPGRYGYKWPTLKELHVHLFEEEFKGAHDALNDAKATASCFFKLKEMNFI